MLKLKKNIQLIKNCELKKSASNLVFGDGNINAKVMIVGEGPGAQEDIEGIPFVGRAGQLLDEMILALGVERDQTYIANVLKCRPPDNRDPQGEEVHSCETYLHQQIQLIEPRLIIALGRFAAQSLLKSSLPIGKLRGVRHSYEPFGIPLVATYHPAYLLRSPLEKRMVWSDLRLAITELS